MLPPDFRWIQFTGRTGPAHTTWLQVGNTAVAIVAQRIDGQWYAAVERHAPPDRWKSADCRDQAQGKAWVEKWAAREADRLRRQPCELANPEYWAQLGDED